MNHHELIVSSAKRVKSRFLRLPQELQDEVIAGLDANLFTLHQASALIKERGYSLSHNAIARYCAKVRRERRAVICKQQGGLDQKEGGTIV